MRFLSKSLGIFLIFSNFTWACSFCTSAGYVLFVSEMKKKGIGKDGMFIILKNLKTKKFFCPQFELIFEGFRQERIRKEMGVGKYSDINTKETQEKEEINNKNENEPKIDGKNDFLLNSDDKKRIAVNSPTGEFTQTRQNGSSVNSSKKITCKIFLTLKMEENFETFKSQRGSEILCYENHMYNLDFNKDGTKRWRCHNRSCKGAIILDEEKNIKKKVEHSHPPVPDLIRRKKVLRNILEKSASTEERSIDIVIKELPTLKESEKKSAMPSIKYMRDSIKRKRNNLMGHVTGGIIDIPDILKFDSKGNTFLRYDSSFEDKERFIIFFTEFKSQYVLDTETFIIDGTFKSSPQGFYQLVVLHGYFFGRTYPLIYILLSNKTESSYVKAFNKCTELLSMNIKFIVTDFERALINAIQTSFPEAEHHGCLFHLGQAAYKRVSTMGEIEYFKNDALYKKAFKMMLCLAFVPSEFVLDFYGDIKEFIEENKIETIHNFKNYFEKNYLGLVNEKGVDHVANVGFPINFWNAFSRIGKEIPRTSNNAESWNRTLNSRMETPNPNIAKFITSILQIEEIDIFNLQRCAEGHMDVKMKSREFKIRLLIQNFKRFSRKEYMEAIYNLVRFKFERKKKNKTL